MKNQNQMLSQNAAEIDALYEKVVNTYLDRCEQYFKDKKKKKEEK